MENINEKLENIEEIMDLLIGQMKFQDEKLSVIIEHQNSQIDETVATTTLDKEIIPSIEDINRFQVSMNQLNKKIEQLPEAFKVKHQYHYEIKSKFYFIGVVIIFFCFCIFFGGWICIMLRYSERPN
jgi:ATP-dependent Zn protease